MILIGADFVPTESNQQLFASGDGKGLFGNELEQLLLQADFRIFNIEVPLCDELHPIQKCGENFSAPTATVNGYCAAHTDLVTLGNNHILDQGEQGLLSTCNVLKQKGIDYVGVGKTPSEAAIPYIFAYRGKTVGVYACVEHEFSIVSEKTAGANPFDALDSPDHVAELKRKCDFVIVLYHGGKEHYQYPSPMLQKTCRKLVDKGADLVICQHSHCIGCEEKYNNGTIVYGQGNFLFDKSKREMWKTGLLIGVDERFQISFIPLIKNGNGVRLAEGEQKEKILSDFGSRSIQIKEEGFVERSFTELTNVQTKQYLMRMRGKTSLPFRALNKLSGYRLNRFALRHYGADERTAIKNFVECEAIREVIIHGLDNSEW